MKTIKTKLAAAVLLLPLFAAGQDIHFSQLTETPLLLNPAQAALTYDFGAIINYRDQWKSISAAAPFKTFNVSADVALLKKDNGNHMGLGVNVFSDKGGDGAMGTTTGQLDLSGVLAANDNHLISAGIYGGFGQRSLQYDKLYWDNQYIAGSLDPTAPSMEPAAIPNHSYADLGFGAAWFYGQGHNTLSSNDAFTMSAGFSVQHLNKPVYTFYGNNDMRLPVKYVAHGNAEIGLKNYSLVLQPAYLVTIQGGHHEITAGTLVKYWLQEASKYTGRKKPAGIVLGGYYRFGDAANIVAAYELNQFRIGVSYDLNLSDLTVASKSRGGFEVSLRFVTSSAFGKRNNSKLFN